jgi:sugar (pentulose or hexulose) kinase
MDIDHKFMTKANHFLIADIGKTNKKLLLVDAHLRTIDEKKINIDLIDHQDLQWEDNERFLSWMLTQLGEWSQSYQITHLAISAHGATMGLVDAHGKNILDMLSYTSEVPASLLSQFNEEVIGDLDLHIMSSSPNMGIINLIRQIYVLEHLYPESWSKVDKIMPYNSYLAYQLCGEMSCEISYMGNHSGLWNHHYQHWNIIAQERGYSKLFSSFANAWDVLGHLSSDLKSEYHIQGDIQILTGLHDSNAAFLPYLIKGIPNITLLSTGTWCLAMATQSSLDLSQKDLDMGAYHNIDVFGNPFKTIGFTGGHEYAVWSKRIGSSPSSNSSDAIQKVLNDQNVFIFPGIMGGTVFPGLPAGIFIHGKFIPHEEIDGEWDNICRQVPLASIDAALNISLAIQASQALRGAATELQNVVVEGGFINNPPFLALLKNLLPESEIMTSSLNEASAYGAACAALAASRGTSPKECGDIIDIPLTPITPEHFSNLNAYQETFIQHHHSLEVIA